MKTELWANKVGEFSWENELAGIFLPTIVAAAIEMYGYILNFGQLSHWYINPKLAKTFKAGSLTLCKNFVK